MTIGACDHWSDMVARAEKDPAMARRLLGTAAHLLKVGAPLPDELRLYLAERLGRIANSGDCEYELHLKRRHGDRSLSPLLVELRLGMVAALRVRFDLTDNQACVACAEYTGTNDSGWRRLVGKHKARLESFQWYMRQGLLSPDLYLTDQLVKETLCLFPNA